MKKEDEEISFATSKKNMLKFKLVFVGDQAVGKSSIITRFIKDQFDPAHNPTVGIDFVSKNMNISGMAVRLQLWDTAGQQRFRSLIPGYLRDCQAAFIVFDLTNHQTFESIHRWIDFVKQSRGDDALIYVIGNKCDLSQTSTIRPDLLKGKAKQWDCKVFEVSAKTGQNLQNVFKEVCADLMNLNEKPEELSLEMQKSKLVQFGMTVEGDRAIGTKNKSVTWISKKQQKISTNDKYQQKQATKLVNPKTQNPRRVTQKNCC